MALFAAFANSAQTIEKDVPLNVSIAQKLGTTPPLDLQFRDEHERVVRLGDYFKGRKPVILTFMYYRCPMLCSMVMEGVSSALAEMKPNVGEDFDVITVSIDPRDTPSRAREVKEKYLRRYGRMQSAAGWHFLTGHDSMIRQLTSAVGFNYSYDMQSDQFGHGAALLVLTPQGTVSRYFYGFDYKARDVRLALVEASSGKIGTATDKLLLLCYHYDPITGKYTRAAMNFVRAGGVATILSLGGFIFVMIRRDRRLLQGTQKGEGGRP